MEINSRRKRLSKQIGQSNNHDYAQRRKENKLPTNNPVVSGIAHCNLNGHSLEANPNSTQNQYIPTQNNYSYTKNIKNNHRPNLEKTHQTFSINLKQPNVT